MKTAGNPHFESLQFIESAGDWAPDNRRFVFGALTKGQPVLSIVDVDNGRSEGEYEIAGVDQIFNPAWSPDGKRIAFSAMTGGVLDLFLFEIETRVVTRLTSDPVADLDPEWAPGGNELAWVTDRFSTKIDTLAYGNYRIGLMNVATKEARMLGGFDNARNTNPEFSADGRSMLFVATPDGISNVFRLDLESGQMTAITNVLSGVSGITPLTPALSAAAKADNFVFTVFEDNHYNIYVADRAVPVTPAPEPLEGRTGAILPPFNRTPGTVSQYLLAAADGLPPEAAIKALAEEEYRAKLGLEGAMQPTVGAGVDRFGAYAAGGITLFFRDMLGNHELITSIQASSRFDEFGGAVAYFNRKHRWNWGLIGQQTPYATGGYGQRLVQLDGQTVIADEELRITQMNRAFTGVLQYPVQPRAPRRALRWLPQHRLLAAAGHALLLGLDAATGRRGARRSPQSGHHQPGRSVHRAGLRHVGLRRHQSDSGSALPAGVQPARRLDHDVERAHRLPQVLHAAAPVHPGLSRRALRTLRQ